MHDIIGPLRTMAHGIVNRPAPAIERTCGRFRTVPLLYLRTLHYGGTRVLVGAGAPARASRLTALESAERIVELVNHA